MATNKKEILEAQLRYFHIELARVERDGNSIQQQAALLEEND